MSAKPLTQIPEGRPILLAEDNEDDVIMTQRALRIGKVKNPVYIVRDGEEAPDYLQKAGSKYADAATPGDNPAGPLRAKTGRLRGLELCQERRAAACGAAKDSTSPLARYTSWRPTP
jgi:hypothetical protein